MEELDHEKKLNLIEAVLRKHLEDWDFNAHYSAQNISMIVLYTGVYDSVTISIRLELIDFTTADELKKTLLYRVREAIQYKIGNIRCEIAQLKEIAQDINLDKTLKRSIRCFDMPSSKCGNCGKEMMCPKC